MNLPDQLGRLHRDAQALVHLIDATIELALIDATIELAQGQIDALRADLNTALMRASKLADDRDTLSWLLAEARDAQHSTDP